MGEDILDTLLNEMEFLIQILYYKPKKLGKRIY